MKIKLHTSTNWLRQRYLYDKKTIEEMAKEAGVVPMTIRRALERIGIK
jgi:DNA-binding MurR/RpiR family transcriptional regulator